MNHFFNTFFNVLPRRQVSNYNDDDNDDNYLRSTVHPNTQCLDSSSEDEDSSKESSSSSLEWEDNINRATCSIQNKQTVERLTENLSVQRSTENLCIKTFTNNSSVDTNRTSIKPKQPQHLEESEKKDENVDLLPLPCIVCEGATRTMLFLECNHCCSCETCSMQLDRCPICRKMIARKVKIIFS